MPPSLQNQYLTLLLKHKTAVTVFLKTGVGLRGLVTHFDDQTLLLEQKGQQQLIYTTSIVSVVPLTAEELNKPVTRKRPSNWADKVC